MDAAPGALPPDVPAWMKPNAPKHKPVARPGEGEGVEVPSPKSPAPPLAKFPLSQPPTAPPMAPVPKWLAPQTSLAKASPKAAEQPISKPPSYPPKPQPEQPKPAPSPRGTMKMDIGTAATHTAAVKSPAIIPKQELSPPPAPPQAKKAKLEPLTSPPTAPAGSSHDDDEQVHPKYKTTAKSKSSQPPQTSASSSHEAQAEGGNAPTAPVDDMPTSQSTSDSQSPGPHPLVRQLLKSVSEAELHFLLSHIHFSFESIPIRISCLSFILNDFGNDFKLIIMMVVARPMS